MSGSMSSSDSIPRFARGSFCSIEEPCEELEPRDEQSNCRDGQNDTGDAGDEPQQRPDDEQQDGTGDVSCRFPPRLALALGRTMASVMIDETSSRFSGSQ